jgi:hypothetical protein
MIYFCAKTGEYLLSGSDGRLIIRSVAVRSGDHILERQIFFLAFPDELVMIPPEIYARGCDLFGYYGRTNFPA